MTDAMAVVVVEDDPLLRALLREYLESEGYEVHEAPEGEEAIRVMLELEWQARLVITDIVMPGMDGIQLGEWIEDNKPEIPVLYITGFARPEIEVLPSILLKPFTRDALLAKIKSTLTLVSGDAQ